VLGRRLPERTIRYTAAAAFAVFGVSGIWTAGYLEADPVLHQVALFAHLACLVIGFGAA